MRSRYSIGFLLLLCALARVNFAAPISDWIRAPKKQFFLVPDTGHADSIASLAVVHDLLKTKIKPR